MCRLYCIHVLTVVGAYTPAVTSAGRALALVAIYCRWMTRQAEFSRKNEDLVPAPIMRHSSFIAGISSDASVDMDLSNDGMFVIY